MNDLTEFLYAELTNKILAAAFHVHDVLGSGFLEKVYENALVIELRKAGLEVRQQYPLKVFYEGVVVGEYFADLLIEDRVVVELKVASELTKVHYHQLQNYLTASGFKVGLLLGFGEKGVVVRRKDLL
ncbi:MAG: GxxExxY protein [Bacillota bacterium]|nr:GxxExxY protein [Bacillota bacterium]